MSGVQVGTRLEQLEALHARVSHELEAERLAVARGHRRTPVPPIVRRRTTDLVMDRLQRHEPLPPAAVIRSWAIANGYMPATQTKGPIPLVVADLYREQVMG